MKLLPVITEQSTKDSKEGKYTFWVPSNMTKDQIKMAISEIFSVHVKEIKTSNFKSFSKRNMKGKKQSVRGGKKAIVRLAEGQKIEVFDPTTRKASKGKSKKGEK